MQILPRLGASIDARNAPDAISAQNSPQILAIRRDLSSRTAHARGPGIQILAGLRLTDSCRLRRWSLLTDEDPRMRFNSYAFALFFAALLPSYWLLRKWRPAQNVLLLAAGYYFYACWNPKFLSLLILSTVVDYALRPLAGSGRKPARPAWHPRPEHGAQPGHARLLQVLQFLRRELARFARECGRVDSAAATSRSCCRSASRSTRSSR